MAKKKLASAISVLAYEAGFEDGDFSVLGDHLDNRFELPFVEIFVLPHSALCSFTSRCSWVGGNGKNRWLLTIKTKCQILCCPYPKLMSSVP